ncbi:mechanosensitive ion channel domain-containing protein [Mycobacterium paraterrae]|uniref:Mechanosensitive ion channel family protein n=1 Tax=Mycobacterium paraterrae TaxID=577492 RepID=A0ABY3VS90_9MYCO|nr:mechanosensitive ion channel family protein [Mycobacterium paraterrae]UMB71274.1 mechanosensitive ion channel family protein [Mycobacterium paraterrae]
MTGVDPVWLYWAIGLAIGLPLLLIGLTEWQQFLTRRQSSLAQPVNLLRSYVVPLAALLVLLVNVARVPAHVDSVRVLATVFGFVLLVLVLSGLNATVFEAAPESSWRKRVPTIFRDVTRFLLIAVGLALIFSYVWGVRVGGLFTALGVTSVVIGLMLQNSVGQIVSGLFMLFEQPFRIGDWLDTPTARGRIVEANWRAVHIQTGHGLQITPNSVLAATSFTNLSRPPGRHTLSITTTFAAADPPDRVRTLLVRTASALPQRKADVAPTCSVTGSGGYTVSVALRSPADDGAAKATFLRWIWYAARRAELHLDDVSDDYSTPARVQVAMRDVVAPALRLSLTDQQSLIPHARMIRYGADEIVQYAGEVPMAMTFVIKGSIRRTMTNDDGSVTPLSLLEEGSFLGLSSLTRQPSLAGAYALDEVTALEIDREHIEDLVLRTPLLLQELGRILEDRRSESSVGAVAARP